MNEEFVRERITQLRLRKGVSEYQMSYDLGYSRGYVYNISSGDVSDASIVIDDNAKTSELYGQLKLPEGLVVPCFGVYESVVTVGSESYKGVTNIGSRPTVGTEKILSETHIIDFNGDLYGKCVDIRLVRFIRKEQKFSSFQELIEQIKSDVSSVKGGV